MSMTPETGKDRWKRVPKDYYKTPNALDRAKRNFSLLALGLVVIWCALGISWKNPEGKPARTFDLRANHGTLAKVHATWDNKCEACHVPFEPIDGRPLLASKSNPASRTSDHLCKSCHSGEKHHEAILDSEVRSCAECHRDHRGRDASLVRLDDVECVRCHQSLGSYTDPSKKGKDDRKYEDRITGFDGTHPDFKLDQVIPADEQDKSLKYPGGFKFNHALHLTPGIVKKAGQKEYTVGQIPIASERHRYGDADKDPVALKCDSCHVLEASDLGAGADPSAAARTLPVRGDGKYFQPIRFETQCRACHDLNFDPESPDIRAPHGVQPDIVVDFLKRTYAAQAIQDDPRFSATFVPPTSIPGKAPADPKPRETFEKKVALAESSLFGTPEPEASNPAGPPKPAQNCTECHEKSQKDAVLKRVAPTNIPTVWLKHAQFDHSAHRAVDCRACHEHAYESSSSKDILLPGVKNCQQCHAPASSGGSWLPWSSSSSNPTGGVAYNCTECHTYHHGDHPLQGVGAKLEDATQTRTVEEFLRAIEGKPRDSKERKP